MKCHTHARAAVEIPASFIRATLPSSWTPIQLGTACWTICINFWLSDMAWLKSASPSGNILRCPQAGLALKWKLDCGHDLYTTVTLMLADATSAASKSMTIGDWLCESEWNPSMRAWFSVPTRPWCSPSQRFPVLLRWSSRAKRDFSPDPEPPLLL